MISARTELGEAPPNAITEERRTMEVHFGRPVVARVRKCRLVVVKNKRTHEDPVVDQRAH